MPVSHSCKGQDSLSQMWWSIMLCYQEILLIKTKSPVSNSLCLFVFFAHWGWRLKWNGGQYLHYWGFLELLHRFSKDKLCHVIIVNRLSNQCQNADCPLCTEQPLFIETQQSHFLWMSLDVVFFCNMKLVSGWLSLDAWLILMHILFIKLFIMMTSWMFFFRETWLSDFTLPCCN